MAWERPRFKPPDDGKVANSLSAARRREFKLRHYLQRTSLEGTIFLGDTSSMTTREPTFRCPCCGDTTIHEAHAYEICACGWEDDPVQAEHPDRAGGANEPSLNEARRAWRLRPGRIARQGMHLPS